MSSNFSSDPERQREQLLCPPGNTELSPTARNVSESFTGNYPYQPLQSDRHIRLLLLEPPDSSFTQDSPLISATLHEVNLPLIGSLTSFPPYKALSYEWGLPPSDPSDTPMMLLDNHSIHIRQNLHDALRSILHNHHRLYGESPLYLWVGALCINQLDDREKGHQVQLMKKIYQTAEMVVIWLGMGTQRTDGAMGLINMDGQGLKQCVEEKVKGQKFTFTERWGLLDLYYTATYWKRVWIVQEFVVARDYVVLCNRAFLTKEHFERGLRILEDMLREFSGMWDIEREKWLYPTWPLEWLREAPVNLVIALRDSGRSRVTSPVTLDRWLDTLCSAHGPFKATDPRDYVFAVLGISYDGDKIIPNYELSTWEVYCMAMSTRQARFRISSDEDCSRNAFYLRWANLMGIPKHRADELKQMLKLEEGETSGPKSRIFGVPSSSSLKTL